MAKISDEIAITIEFDDVKKGRVIKLDTKFGDMEDIMTEAFPKLVDTKFHMEYGNNVTIDAETDWSVYLECLQNAEDEEAIIIHATVDAAIQDVENEENKDNAENVDDAVTIPDEGMICWFDATDLDTLSPKKWKSKINDYYLTPTETIAQNKIKFKPKSILLKQSPNLKYVNGVYCDYCNTLKFNEKFNDVKTIVSIHNYLNEIDLNEIHSVKVDEGYSNFYMLTSSTNNGLHGGINTCMAPDFKHSDFSTKITLDTASESLPGDKVELWNNHRIAILTINPEADTKKWEIDQIGADRIYNHFCGSIIELIVYDRVLKGEEIKILQDYLNKKYFIKYGVESGIENIENNENDDNNDNNDNDKEMNNEEDEKKEDEVNDQDITPNEEEIDTQMEGNN